VAPAVADVLPAAEPVVEEAAPDPEEELLVERLRMPPMGPAGGVVEVVAFFASAWKAASVLPVAGALMAATMPDWQWLPVVWPQ